MIELFVVDMWRHGRDKHRPAGGMLGFAALQPNLRAHFGLHL